MGKSRIGRVDEYAGIQPVCQQLSKVCIFERMHADFIQLESPGRRYVRHILELRCLVCVQSLFRPLDVLERHINTSKEELVTSGRLSRGGIRDIQPGRLILRVAFVDCYPPFGSDSVICPCPVRNRITGYRKFVILRDGHWPGREDNLRLVAYPISEDRSPDSLRICLV